MQHGQIPGVTKPVARLIQGTVMIGSDKFDYSFALLDDILARRRVHVARNPRMARVLMELTFMRQQGEGIPRMIEEMEASWLPVPEFFASAHQFRVVLRNEPIFEGRDPAWTAHVRNLPVNVRQKRALVAFSDAQSFQSTDYQQLNRVDRDVAYRELSALVSKSLVHKEGSGRSLKYKVAAASLPALMKAKPAPMAALVERMQTAGFIRNEDYREAFAVGRFEASRALNTLVKAGVLVKTGERRGARYTPGPSWPPPDGQL